MRIEAGPYYSESSDGRRIGADRPLSREQVDLVLRVVEHHGLTPLSACAVEISEGGTSAEALPSRCLPLSEGRYTEEEIEQMFGLA
jgi:hypothetical protein